MYSISGGQFVMQKMKWTLHFIWIQDWFYYHYKYRIFTTSLRYSLLLASVHECTISHARQSNHQMRNEPATTKIASAQKHLLIHLFLTRRQSSCLKSESTGIPNTRHRSIIARGKVKGQGKGTFSFQFYCLLCIVFRLNRGNFSLQCAMWSFVERFVCIWEATRLPSFGAARKVINANLSAAHPSSVQWSIDRGNRRRSEVTEILRLAAGRRSTVKHAASGTRPEIQIWNGRAIQEALSGFWGKQLSWILCLFFFNMHSSALWFHTLYNFLFA